MATINDIIEESKKYLDGYSEQVKRFNAWRTSLPTIKTSLDKICNAVIANNDYFKSNLFVGGASESTGVFIKSGSVSVPLSNGASEQGFQINFVPLANGRVLVFANGHSTSSNGQQINIELIDDPSILTESKVTELVLKGIETVRKTSYLFMGD